MLFTVSALIEYHNRQDTPVHVASLDASKAFDKIRHYGLFISLMECKVPAPFLIVLNNWHLRLSGVVRREGALSHMIKFMSGIRQGGILSGLCFNMYVSPLINKPKTVALATDL